MNQEPAPAGSALRRFKDPVYREVAATLGDLRERIDRIDEQLVDLLAQRALLVQDATRFKADAYQVAAPARQAQVFARVRERAARRHDLFEGFADIVDTTFRTLVGAFVAREHRFFEQTEPVPTPGHGSRSQP